jgi:tetratricopeptide (TPR) repeat protein
MRASIHCLLAIGLVTAAACTQSPVTTEEMAATEENRTVYSLLGSPLVAAEPPQEMVEKYEQAWQDWEDQPADVERIIWYGRRTAYLGRYLDAIDIYTEGIRLHPQEPRPYRHRGHRYISVRKLDLAIADFEHAANLIEGTADQIEPDGLPNAKNIPLSTLHGNIWYHLGLAYYLSGELESAERAYRECLAVSGNDDMVVATLHWLYMTLRRLDRSDEAEQVLAPVNTEMEIIENMAYHTSTSPGSMSSSGRATVWCCRTGWSTTGWS